MEAQTQLGLWAMAASPLWLGFDPRTVRQRRCLLTTMTWLTAALPMENTYCSCKPVGAVHRCRTSGPLPLH